MLFMEAASLLTRFVDGLAMCGIGDEVIAEAVRLGGDEFPVFGQQIKGCYISNGVREAHFAVPGWYRIVSVYGNSATIRKEHGDEFSCSVRDIRFVLEPNLECVEKGTKP